MGLIKTLTKFIVKVYCNTANVLIYRFAVLGVVYFLPNSEHFGNKMHDYYIISLSYYYIILGFYRYHKYLTKERRRKYTK